MKAKVAARLTPKATSAVPKKGPAKAVDQIDHRVEQSDRPPWLGKHVDRIKGAAEERQRRDNQKRDDLELLKALGPNADDEPEQAKCRGDQHQEQQHP